MDHLLVQGDSLLLQLWLPSWTISFLPGNLCSSGLPQRDSAIQSAKQPCPREERVQFSLSLSFSPHSMTLLNLPEPKGFFYACGEPWPPLSLALSRRCHLLSHELQALGSSLISPEILPIWELSQCTLLEDSAVDHPGTRAQEKRKKKINSISICIIDNLKCA